MNYTKAAASVAGALLLASISAEAIPNTFTYSAGNLNASASFDIVGGNLQVTLANTATVAPSVPSQILTGVFFSGADGLTPLSAYLPSGSLLWLNGASTPASGLNVGGEWAYAYTGGSGNAQLQGTAPGGATAGISSTGLGLFGNPNFNGPNLAGPNAVGGLQFGLVSPNYAGGGNGGVLGNYLVASSVVFTLSGFTGSLDDITHVNFQYGTSLGETPCVPDSGTTAIMLGAALSGLGIAARKFKK